MDDNGSDVYHWYFIGNNRMREEMNKIKERHAKEIADFIEACPHPKITGWIPFMWAPGHFSHNVKVCERCGKTVDLNDDR